jgi:hypothetical protein
MTFWAKLTAATPSAPPTGTPSTADWMTAWGTLFTAIGALVAVAVTIWLASRDRRDGEKARIEERARHERELAEERKRSAQDREDAERRLAEERTHAEELRRRDRREASVGGLLGRIADLMPFCSVVPGLYQAIYSSRTTFPTDLLSLGITGPFTEQEAKSREARETVRRATLMEAWEAVRSLARGGHSEIWGLGDTRAAEQYRKLVYLVLSATTGNIPADLRVRAGKDLRRYALWVRVSLETLTETGHSLDPGIPPWPDLTRMPANDVPWQPSIPSQTWQLAILQEPGDPAYLPAHLPLVLGLGGGRRPYPR